MCKLLHEKIVYARISEVFRTKDCRSHKCADVISRWDGIAVSVSSKILSKYLKPFIIRAEITSILYYEISLMTPFLLPIYFNF